MVGWLASGGVRASTLDNSPKASAEGVVPHLLPSLKPNPFAETKGPPLPTTPAPFALEAAEGWRCEVVF